VGSRSSTLARYADGVFSVRDSFEDTMGVRDSDERMRMRGRNGRRIAYIYIYINIFRPRQQ